MDPYPRQKTFKQPSNVQDDYMPTPTQPQTNSALSQSLDSPTIHIPVGGKLSEVEGDIACSATVVKCKYTPPVTYVAITTSSPRRLRKSYHISKPSQEDLCDAANLFSAPQPA